MHRAFWGLKNREKSGVMFGYRDHAILHRGLGNRKSEYRQPRSIEFFWDDDEIVG